MDDSRWSTKARCDPERSTSHNNVSLGFRIFTADAFVGCCVEFMAYNVAILDSSLSVCVDPSRGGIFGLANDVCIKSISSRPGNIRWYPEKNSTSDNAVTEPVTIIRPSIVYLCLVIISNRFFEPVAGCLPYTRCVNSKKSVVTQRSPLLAVYIGISRCPSRTTGIERKNAVGVLLCSGIH